MGNIPRAVRSRGSHVVFYRTGAGSLHVFVRGEYLVPSQQKKKFQRNEQRGMM